MAKIVEGFQAASVITLTGITERQLWYWKKIGLIVPSIFHGSGRDQHSIWSFEDVVAIRTINKLRQAGIPMPSIAKVAEWFKTREPKTSFANVVLFSDGNDVFALTSDTVISALRRPGQTVMWTWVIDLEQVVVETQGDIIKMAA